MAMTSSTCIERISSSSSPSSSLPRHPSSAQERAGQTVYVSPAEPIQAVVEPMSVQRSPGQMRQQPASQSVRDFATGTGSSVFTVSAPSNVEVERDTTGGTFTLTFGGGFPDDLAARQVQGQAPVMWQPTKIPLQSKSTADAQQVSAFGASGGGVGDSVAGSRPPQLSRILQESKDLDSPDTPSSPQGKSASKLKLIVLHAENIPFNAVLLFLSSLH